MRAIALGVVLCPWLVTCGVLALLHDETPTGLSVLLLAILCGVQAYLDLRKETPE